MLARWIRILLVVLFVMSGVSSVAVAAEPIQLSLHDCIDRALRENLMLTSTALGLQARDWGIVRAESAFDPTVSLSINRDEAHTPNFYDYINVSAITQERTSANLTLGQNLESGANWGFGVYNTLSESNIEVQKNYTSYLGLMVNQPLLRGFGRRVNRTYIYLAQLGRDSDRLALEGQAISLLADVTTAYWNLVHARLTMDVRKLAYDQADSLLTYNRAGLEVGLMIRSDVLEAESELLRRRQEILGQEQMITDAEDVLRRLINLPEQDWERGIEPGDVPEIPRTFLDESALLDEALERRPDYLMAVANRELVGINRYRAERMILPGLDLSASYRLNGSGGTYGKNINRMTEVEEYGWNLGLLFSYPLKNRSAKADLEEQRIGERRADIAIEDIEQIIHAQIRAALRDVRTTGESIEVARMEVDVNEQKLRVEEERFRNKLSTSYYVLQFQRDLADSRNLLNRAIIDHLIARVELGRARGTLLGEQDVSILISVN
jgi:outer membrane protein